MANEDELLITYGIGYVFKNNKLVIVSDVEKKTILKNEIEIIEEINKINDHKEKLYLKSCIGFAKDYILQIEETLEEKISDVFPMITSITLKNRTMEKQVHLMEEYLKNDLNQRRLKKEGFIKKDIGIIQNYLDNFKEDLSPEDNNKLLKYNKIIKKIILTTSFGNEFNNFLNNKGQANNQFRNEQFLELRLEQQIKNNFIIKKPYSELDFLNLILFLEEREKQYFSWDEKYTSLIFSINKNGEKHNSPNWELKNSVISFIKGNKYLYFSYCKHYKNDLFLSLNNEIYSGKHKEIDLNYDEEIGYLLLCNKEKVYISIVVYDKKNNKIKSTDKFENFSLKMTDILDKHLIM